MFSHITKFHTERPRPLVSFTILGVDTTTLSLLLCTRGDRSDVDSDSPSIFFSLQCTFYIAGRPPFIGVSIHFVSCPNRLTYYCNAQWRDRSGVDYDSPLIFLFTRYFLHGRPSFLYGGSSLSLSPAPTGLTHHCDAQWGTGPMLIMTLPQFSSLQCTFYMAVRLSFIGVIILFVSRPNRLPLYFSS